MRKINEVSFAEIENKFDTNIESGINEGLPWDVFKEILADCDRRPDKEGPAFIPVTFKDRKDWTLSQGLKPSYRHEDNVKSISMIVFDLDNKGAFEKAEKLFDNFEYVVYSTHSYSKEEPYKLRIVLPLAEEITPEQWRKSFDLLKHSIDADKQCGDLSRCYYFSSMRPDSGIEPFYQYNEGTIISYNSLQKATKNYISELPVDEQQRIQEELKKDERKTREFKEKASLVNQGPVLANSDFSSSKKVSRGTSLNMSYEGFKSRHEERIDELVNNGSNYQFCRDVCWHEVLKAKENTDFRLLVQFIVRASVEYSGDQSVIHKKGSNTLAEFPNNVISSMGKIDREMLKNFSEDFKNELYAYVSEARFKQKNNQWDFPVGKSARTQIEKKDLSLEETEKSMRLRFKAELGEFYVNIQNRNVGELFSKVIHNELRNNKANFNINKISEFLFMQIERAYIKGFSIDKKENLISLLNEDFNMLKDNNGYFTSEIKKELPKFRDKFFVGSLKKALSCSKGEIERTIKADHNRENGYN